jgi:uncharacterized protein involved in oxidation of intracellular sulfur
MKLGLVIYSNDAETVWNALRLGYFALQKGDNVQAFFLGKGVESVNLDTEQFKVTEQLSAFAEAGGEILACGTCLHIRQQNGNELCPASTMANLYNLISNSDKVLSF